MSTNSSTFKTSNAPGDVHTNILENFVINAKPETFSVNKRKKHTSIFRSSHQIDTLKPSLITSLKKIDDRTTHTSRTNIATKTASSLIKSISINVCLPQGRDWPFLVILGSSTRHDKDESRSLRNKQQWSTKRRNLKT